MGLILSNTTMEDDSRFNKHLYLFLCVKIQLDIFQMAGIVVQLLGSQDVHILKKYV